MSLVGDVYLRGYCRALEGGSESLPRMLNWSKRDVIGLTGGGVVETLLGT